MNAASFPLGPHGAGKWPIGLIEIWISAFLHPEDGSQKAILVVVISSLVKIPKAFLIRTVRNETLHTRSC